jgi:hypothetical protein
MQMQEAFCTTNWKAIPMGYPFRILIPHASRPAHRLRLWIVLVLIFFAFGQQHHLFFIYREALAAKYSPTKLPSSSTEQHLQAWIPDEESAFFQDRLIANRATWKTLGEGWEGKTFVFEDSVIKTFTPGRSPYRNCASSTMYEAWPTEIPASLHFGGTEQNASSANPGFLPVRSYFKATTSTSVAEWHLVTPLLAGGSLKNLASKLRNSELSYRDVDTYHRPSFNRLLLSLQTLHEEGFCHDDVKTTNIFVAGKSHWVLGDLGNLRHVSHPYHTSLLWRENEQLADCRANDVIRALKSYVRFVRDATNDNDAFNFVLLQGKEPLSRLFWSAAANAPALSAAKLHERSLKVHPQQHVRSVADASSRLHIQRYGWLSVISRSLERQYATNHLLQTRMGEKMARWWALTWIFGIPITTICGV